jgi:hypothetical protein
MPPAGLTDQRLSAGSAKLQKPYMQERRTMLFFKCITMIFKFIIIKNFISGAMLKKLPAKLMNFVLTTSKIRQKTAIRQEKKRAAGGMVFRNSPFEGLTRTG